MPRGDRTGPSGQGSMTGRALGTCNTSNTQFIGRGVGRGRGINRERGIGRFNNYPGNASFTPSLEEEKQLLQNRLDELNKQSEK